MKLLRYSFIPFFLFVAGFAQSQISADSINAYKASIEKYRTGINIKFMYTDKTPLTPEQHESFKGLKYFPPDIKYRVGAKLVRNQEKPVEVMRTSTERAPEYIQYGYVEFELEGQTCRLSVYQDKKADNSEADKSLFIPFRDKTSGSESYGGGRYIDTEIPEAGDFLLLDFNKAYNPYCAYNSRYSCVIPPEENRLSIAIKAGEKIFEEH